MRRLKNGRVIRLVVADPAYTSHGKLRLIGESGVIRTAWWGPTWFPEGYERVR